MSAGSEAAGAGEQSQVQGQAAGEAGAVGAGAVAQATGAVAEPNAAVAQPEAGEGTAGAVQTEEGGAAEEQNHDNFMLNSVHQQQMSKMQSTFETKLNEANNKIAELSMQSQPVAAQAQAQQTEQNAPLTDDKLLKALEDPNGDAVGMLLKQAEDNIMANINQQNTQKQQQDSYLAEAQKFSAEMQLTPEEQERAWQEIQGTMQQDTGLPTRTPLEAILIGRFGTLEAAAQFAQQQYLAQSQAVGVTSEETQQQTDLQQQVAAAAQQQEILKQGFQARTSPPVPGSSNGQQVAQIQPQTPSLEGAYKRVGGWH